MMQKKYEIQSGSAPKIKGGNRQLTMQLVEGSTTVGNVAIPVGMPLTVTFDNPTDDEKAAIEDLDNYRVVATFAFEKIEVSPATTQSSTAAAK